MHEACCQLGIRFAGELTSQAISVKVLGKTMRRTLQGSSSTEGYVDCAGGLLAAMWVQQQPPPVLRPLAVVAMALEVVVVLAVRLVGGLGGVASLVA